MLSHLNGFPIFSNINVGITKINFTKKQTRKFTNTRWTKKYLKKYSHKVLVPQAIFDNVNKCYFIHPIILKQIEQGKQNELR